MVDSRWKTLLKALRLKRSIPEPPRLEQLMKIKRRGKVETSERIEPSEVLMKRSELLYRLEPLLFSGINKLTRRITGVRMFFSNGDEEEIKKVTEFFNNSGLENLLPHLVRDSFIYGFGAAEIVYEKNKMHHFNQIDPKRFNYKRNEEGKISIKDDKIEGYIWEKQNGEEVFLEPREVLLIRFYTLGEYCLGISPVETAFKTAWIKLNLEESLGEALFRKGYPTYVFKIGSPDSPVWREITPEKIEEAKKIIAKIDTTSEMVLPWWISVDTLGGRGDIGGVTGLLEYLSSEILAALELPKAFGVTERGLGGRAVEEMDFEKTILAMQKELADQLMEQVFLPYYKQERFVTKPIVNFTEYAPELQTARLRRVSTYLKYGGLSRTRDLENELRRREGFPLIKTREETKDKCIFGLGKCPIREEQDISLDRLAPFCNICLKRLRAVKKERLLEIQEEEKKKRKKKRSK